MREAVILGGPNGAGKTSWALRYLDPTLGIREFVNADEIARAFLLSTRKAPRLPQAGC